MKSEPTFKIDVYGGAEEIAKAFANKSDAVDVIFIGCSNTQNTTIAPGKSDDCKMGLDYLRN